MAELYDAQWRLRYLTSGYLLSAGIADADPQALGLGERIWSARTADLRDSWPAGGTRESFLETAPALLRAAAGDVPPEVMRAEVPAELRDAVPDGPVDRPALVTSWADIKFGRRTIRANVVGIPVQDAAGRRAGWVALVLPSLSGTLLSLLNAGDHRSLERLIELRAPGRRPAALLFADLEGSTALARRLPAAEYFALVRRTLARIDDEIIGRDGLVGKHAGDGATAFFLSDRAGGESAAARACIETARAIRAAEDELAQRTGLEPGELRLRFGLHWGATLYIGRLLTAGRAEVTALGDEVNAAARIESCASGGLMLASKELLERLEPADALAAGFDARSARFTLLTDLPSASEKARRDAPSIAVTTL